MDNDGAGNGAGDAETADAAVDDEVGAAGAGKKAEVILEEQMMME